MKTGTKRGFRPRSGWSEAGTDFPARIFGRGQGGTERLPVVSSATHRDKRTDRQSKYHGSGIFSVLLPGDAGKDHSLACGCGMRSFGGGGNGHSQDTGWIESLQTRTVATGPQPWVAPPLSSWLLAVDLDFFSDSSEISSMMANSAPSPARGPSFRMRVYPPDRSA